MFNRNKKLSTVIEKIPGLLETHPNFKRHEIYERESGFRSVLHHRDDAARELTLTVHVYEVPSDEET